MRMPRLVWILGLCLSLSATGSAQAARRSAPKPVPATAAEAARFVEQAEKTLTELGLKAARAAWIKANFITDDTVALETETGDAFTAATTELAKKATRFDGVTLPAETRRKLLLLKLALTVPGPEDEAERQEMSRLASQMDADFGSGKYCPAGEKDDQGQPRCYSLQDAMRILATDRDERAQYRAWDGWHSVAAKDGKQKAAYARFVELANKGARQQNFKDLGALWRSNYDMPPDRFAAEMERLWQQVKPLYDSLHAYVRYRLQEKYGKQVVPDHGPIPAHLLGNMWAQQWNNIYPLVAPPAADPGYDLSEILKSRHTDAIGMVRYGEKFYTSLGFDPLPETFWQRSLFVKPRDRDVICHASAWDLDNQKDVRIKMCIEVGEEDFSVIHHELGHNYYQMAYRHQSPLFQGGANDGFHEAIGDTIALSVTPIYMKQLGFIEKEPDAGADTGLLLRRALDKVAFLPFGYLVDQWRWKVFSGEIKPADYNRTWWELRKKYQGVAPATPRGEEYFDAWAKYHVAGNVPYARYFLAAVLQFQFHRALCREAGYSGPLHRCSIYGSKAAGAKLEQMLKLGLSRPWPEALKAMTGEDRMDATAILDYFAPLKAWLDAENAKHGVSPGW
jgi:peptidyl-dipeptidase A